LTVGVRIPLFYGDTRATWDARIHDRMVDPLRIRQAYFAERNIPSQDIVETVYSPFSLGPQGPVEPFPVISGGEAGFWSSGDPRIIDSVWFADSAGEGGESGTESDPTTIDGAVAGAQSQAVLGLGDIIVVTDSLGVTGPDIASESGLTTEQGVQLLQEQIILGGGSSLVLVGSVTGNVGIYTPAGESGTINPGGEFGETGEPVLANLELSFLGANLTPVIGLADNTQVIGIGVTGRMGESDYAQLGIEGDGVFNVLLQDLEVSWFIGSQTVLGGNGQDGAEGAGPGASGFSDNGSDGEFPGGDGVAGGTADAGGEGASGGDGSQGGAAIDEAEADGIRLGE